MRLILHNIAIVDVQKEANGRDQALIYCDEQDINKQILDNIAMVNLLKYLFERQRREDEELNHKPKR